MAGDTIKIVRAPYEIEIVENVIMNSIIIVIYYSANFVSSKIKVPWDPLHVQTNCIGQTRFVKLQY